MALMGIALGMSKEQAAQANEGEDLLGVEEAEADVRSMADSASRKVSISTISSKLRNLSRQHRAKAPVYNNIFKESTAPAPVPVPVDLALATPPVPVPSASTASTSAGHAALGGSVSTTSSCADRAEQMTGSDLHI